MDENRAAEEIGNEPELDDDITLEGEESEEETDQEEESEEEPEEEPEEERRPPPPEVVVKVQQPKKGKEKRPPRKRRDLSDLDEIDQLIEELDPGATTRVYLTITRVDPKVFKGRRIGGYIGKFERHIDTQELKDLHGGGIYDIKFFGPRASGRSNKIITSRRIEIAGDPILDSAYQKEDERVHGTHDPDIVSQTMRAQEKVVDRLESKAKDEKETLLTLLSNKGSGGEEIMGVFTKMLEVSEKRAEAAQRAADAQIAAIREEARTAREEAQRKEERHREEMKEIRREMEDKKSASGDTMIAFMREQNEQNAKRTETTMKTISEMQSKNIEMMASNYKVQADILTNELKRTSDELKDARLSNKGDIVSEMKKLSTIQEVMRGLVGGEKEEKTLTDKLADKLPEIMDSVPDIIQSFGGLFRGGGQRAVRQQRQVAAAPGLPRRMLPAATPSAPLPPRRPTRPAPSSSFPVDRSSNVEDSQIPVQHQQAVEHPQTAAVQPTLPSPEQKQHLELAQEIGKLKIAFENSLEKGEAALTCYKSHIEGQYDEELLRKIAAMPSPIVIEILQQNLDDDSPLFTVKGKDFLRHMHNIIKENFA